MQVLTNTDHNIHATATLAAEVEATVAAALKRFGDQVTRVEVHFSDENSRKGGADDKRCVIEARLAGRPPLAVTHYAPSVEMALDGASEKLVRLIESSLARLRSTAPRMGRVVTPGGVD